MEDYLRLLKGIFDFRALRDFLGRSDFKFVFDGMHGVAGPYAKRIFVQVPPSDTSRVRLSLTNCSTRVIF